MAVAEQTRTGSWKIDPVHSSAAFEVNHNEISLFRGKFNDVDASLDYVAGEPRLTGVVQVSSIDVADPQLAGHLQSPDFFDVERTPEIRFESTAVEYGEAGAIDVKGRLTIKGHSESVTASGTLRYVEADLGGGARYGIDLTTSIDRTVYGLNWNADLPKGGQVLGNDVRLIVHLEFVPGE